MLYLALGFLFIGYVVSTPPLRLSEDVRIVGGEDIDITEAPYQVSIVKLGRHHCGGAIVFKDIIVTAAHCVANTPRRLYKVRVGSSYSNRGGLLYPVADIVWHPNFDFLTLNSDIALIKLAKPLLFNSRIAKIEMESEDEEIEDGGCTVVTGWGATKENGGSPKVLQRVTVHKISDQICLDNYRPQYNIISTMFCAGTPEGGKDACQGDSGGPLVHKNKLSGIVSWGLGCARPEYPGVYTKVSVLRQWLDTNIAKIRLKRTNASRLIQ